MDIEGKTIKLTSAEITNLWTSYMNDKAAICQLKYFEAKCVDKDIKPLIEHALSISQSHITKITDIFNKETYPIPYGFNLEEDVDISAPRLYSDTFVLTYLEQMGKIGLNLYSGYLSYATRDDVYQFFSDCLAEGDGLLKQVNNTSLNKGLYIKSPYLPIPENVDFVKKQSFLTGYLGERRPLTGPEITNLYGNFQRNALGVSTIMGFSQVAKNRDVQQFFNRGKEIAKKHCKIFASVMSSSDIPAPTTWDTEVTDSTNYTFSDKLMMFHTTSLISLSIGYYGTSISTSPRRDMGVHYDRLLHEIMLYAEDGAEIMIKHGWMEEPPRALDRDELSKK